MTVSTLSRTTSAIVLGLILASIGATAATAPSGSSPLGLADRDVIRDPYVNFLGESSLLIPQTIGVVGPTLGLGVGFAPGTIISGGAGGGVPAALGLSAGGNAGGASSIGGSISSNAGSQQNNGGSNSSKSPSTANSNSNSGSGTQQSTDAAANVPDGGATVILLGAGLLATFGFRRRFSGK